LTHTIRGIYKSLWDAAVPVDFLLDSQIEARGTEYKAILLPFPVSLKASLITSLCAYVKSGGVLVSEACPGRLSEFGFLSESGMPGQLQELFGVKPQEPVIVREPKNGSVWTGVEIAYGDTVPYRELAGVGEFAEYSVMPAYLLTLLRATSATTILKDQDHTVGTVHRFGTGSAYLIGTLLGHASLSYGDTRNGDFLVELLNKHGIVADRVGKLQRRRRVWSHQTAWFLFNTTRSPVEENVSVEGFSRVSDLLSDALVMQGPTVQVRLEPMSVRCLILEA
jgi:hypothetical protein